jgi:hypothetical protein
VLEKEHQCARTIEMPGPRTADWMADCDWSSTALATDLRMVARRAVPLE